MRLRSQTSQRHVSDKFSAQDLSDTWSQTSLRQDRCNGIWALQIEKQAAVETVGASGACVGMSVDVEGNS